MNKIRRINKNLKIIISILLLIIIGFSYAYYNITISGNETDTTITGDAGTMTITYAGGSAIDVDIMFPDDAPFATKNFTVTGNNDTDKILYYNLSIVLNTNTFSSGGLQYKLTSTNTGSNGSVVPSITWQEDIETGSRTIILGNGSFTGPTNGDKVHTYSLEFYYPITGGDQSEDQGKSFEAYISVKEGELDIPLYLSSLLLSNYGGQVNITEAPEGTFANINGSTDNLMYKMEDDYGDSYYLRGAKTYLNNNLIFAEKQWKIVRINGDGSIRIIYNGTCPSNSCTINSTGLATQLYPEPFNNSTLTDAKFEGYMFSPAGTTASTSRSEAVTNVTNSNMKTILDTWYSANISGIGYEDYISDSLFCNDRQLQSEVGGAATGPGYGNTDTTYAAYYRLYTNKTPTLKCGLQNDRFTVSNTIIGNGDLTYPIGLLTIDEANIAGNVNNISNTANYLYTNQNWITNTPSSFLSSIKARFWCVTTTNITWECDNMTPFGVRPVINLKQNIKVNGSGTTSDPFVVYIPPKELKSLILAQYGGSSSIAEAPAGTFANINGSKDKLMYKMEDDYGDSYYLRGAKSYLKNNVIFAEYQWKIVRINGDGSIRIIYNGTCPNNSCTINSTGTTTQIGTSAWNTTYSDDAKYLGYMYGGANGTASTSRSQATTNETNSTVKDTLDTWYSANISGTDYEDYISDSLFCNDRQLQSEVGGAATGPGYGATATNYAPDYRLYTNKLPDLQCGLQNDRFTVSDATIGNGDLTYPIGLITADEVALAGFVRSSAATTNYLYTNQSYLLSGPSSKSSSTAYEWILTSAGELNRDYSVTTSLGVRPVISLNSNTLATGSGTTTNPYVIQ